MRDGNWKLVAAAFLASQCLTLVGSSAVQMAIAWYVAVETSSGAWAAAMLVAGFVPQMAISPFAGAWIDRRGFRKAAIIAADAVSAATALALAVFLATSFGDTAALVALAAASSVRSLCAGPSDAGGPVERGYSCVRRSIVALQRNRFGGSKRCAVRCRSACCTHSFFRRHFVGYAA